MRFGDHRALYHIPIVIIPTLMTTEHAHVSVWLIAKFFLNSVKFEFFLGSNYPNLVVCGLCGAIPLGRHSDLKNRLTQ